MDGVRIQKLFKQEVDSMLEIYRKFETLIPSSDGAGSAHRGEDGRYVENLIRDFLSKYLPKDLEVLSGFVLRPAVKTGKDYKGRSQDSDTQSRQLDIIVYDSAHYPIFLRSNDTVIVPPEGVIAIISVKKTLRDDDVKNELNALSDASKLCRINNLRGPFLALVSMQSNIQKKNKDTYKWIFDEMKTVYDNDPELSFDDTVGLVGAFSCWSIFKTRPDKSKLKSKYMLFNHEDRNNEESHLGLQFLLTGIMSVYYDSSRTNLSRPGFTAFPSGRNCNAVLGEITAKYQASPACI